MTGGVALVWHVPVFRMKSRGMSRASPGRGMTIVLRQCGMSCVSGPNFVRDVTGVSHPWDVRELRLSIDSGATLTSATRGIPRREQVESSV
jgi:hypothetical protein